MHICKYLETSSETFCFRHSNDSPTQSVEAKAREELTVAQKELEVCDASSMGAKAQQATVNSLKSVLSPLRRVPPEILFEIALYFQDGSPCHEIESDLWRFGRVCRKWRAVALLSRHLWTTVAIDDMMCVGVRPEPANRVLVEYLKRSGDLPLRVHVKFENYYVDDEPVDHVLINTLVSHSHRWKTLLFTAPDYLWPGLCQVGGHLPILERIACLSTRNEPPTNLDILLPIFSDAPRLRHVDINMNAPIPFLLPWNQLTHYHDNRHGFMSHHKLEEQFFDRCLHLRECTLLSQSPVTNNSRTLLPDLYSLTLASSASLDAVTAPALQFLMIHHGHQERTLDIGILSRFISRSSCSLTALVLFGGTTLGSRIKSDELVPVLKASPQLMQLHVYGVNIQMYFLRSMTLSASSSDLVPLLEDLSLDVWCFDVYLLFSMLESRCSKGSVLQQVSIKCMGVTLSNQLLVRHATLQEKGFRLYFATQNANERQCE
ncbi:uncharacterized protein EV420DRAFT_1644544 [Desarmillaria tabescens]|uniref:F-box domain-containing protein n=1 Tax=Armillaria tabescens TaxID=1929756 RepID=A0AA39K725_ARMTA|nr:uncharacterized protein EV420DRAFT_1644544 [Desarmillaria tabescens]KAK0455766.1 hypothetical protein EV420DRAFT_1644544 [Desarmillaria tabescens]